MLHNNQKQTKKIKMKHDTIGPKLSTLAMYSKCLKKKHCQVMVAALNPKSNCFGCFKKKASRRSIIVILFGQKLKEEGC
jgi:hypothetical protein